MERTLNLAAIFSSFFGVLVLIAGILNLLWVHPVPGIVYIMISGLYFVPAKQMVKSSTGLFILSSIKIALAIVLFFFTLGVSDLGEILGF